MSREKTESYLPSIEEVINALNKFENDKERATLYREMLQQIFELCDERNKLQGTIRQMIKTLEHYSKYEGETGKRARANLMYIIQNGVYHETN